MLVQLSVIRDAAEINRCFEPFFKLVDASRPSVLVQGFLQGLVYWCRCFGKGGFYVRRSWGALVFAGGAPTARRRRSIFAVRMRRRRRRFDVDTPGDEWAFRMLCARKRLEMVRSHNVAF